MAIDLETLVCAVRGHVAPAGRVARLRPEDGGLGIEVRSTWRIARCLRCGVWIGGPPPTEPEQELLAALEEMELPRRGKPLRQAVILRLIAIERAVHAVIFTLIAVLGAILRSHLASAQGWVRRFLEGLAGTESQTGRANNHSIVAREGTRFLHLRSGTLEVLIVTAAIYAVVEGTEAVGLWYEKRWAEYLTAVATAGFLPFEIHELLKRVTVLRVSALVVNLAILVYLVYAKRLFGVRRHRPDADHPASPAELAAFSPPF